MLRMDQLLVIQTVLSHILEPNNSSQYYGHTYVMLAVIYQHHFPFLQDSPLTNAGIGSNLSLTGTVECDASLMDGSGGYGAVGALQGQSVPWSTSTD